MKVPPMVPSARERVDAAYNRWDDPDDPACNIEDIHAEAMEQAFRDGYAAGFAAALGKIAPKCNCGFIDTDLECVKCAVLKRAAASALADSTDKSTHPSPQE